MSFLGDITSREYTPYSLSMALQMASSMDLEVSRSLVIIWAINSASLVEWKMAPCISNFSLKSSALRIEPLLAMAIWPFTWRNGIGWAFSRLLLSAVP